MIYEKDLDEAIAECQGKRNPDAQTCMKLAAFYTIKQHLYGKQEQREQPVSEPVSSYYYSAGDDVVSYESDTEFGHIIKGRKISELFPILDELVDTVRIVNPRLYDAFLRKLG